MEAKALTYDIRPTSQLAGGRIDIVSLRDLASSRYAELGFDLRPEDFVEQRERNSTVVLARDVDSPDLLERWRKYDEEYQAERRLGDFWVHSFQDCTVLPSMMALQGRSFLKTTIRFARALHSVFPDVDRAAFKPAFASPEHKFASTVDLAPKRFIDEPCFLLGTGMFNNYFNWTVRYTSRLHIFNQLRQDTFLLVPATKKAYVRDTLQLFGVPEERVIAVDEPIGVRSLVLAAPLIVGRYELSPLMRTTLTRRPPVRARPPGASRRLYVPRANVAMREVVNEAEIIGALRRDGFEIFDNAEHSIEEQIEAFAGADTIVAPHGAGLTNIVYSSPGTRIIELIPEGYDQGVTSYRSLADLFGHHYSAILCREAATDPKGNRCNSNISIDLSTLREHLDLDGPEPGSPDQHGSGPETANPDVEDVQGALDAELLGPKYSDRIYARTLKRIFQDEASFIAQSGWIDTLQSKRSLWKGKTVPWFNYGFIRFLSERVRPDMRVFEFGAGNSTIWWQDQVKEVVAVEHNLEWINRLRPQLRSNVRLLHREQDIDGAYCRTILDVGGEFDIVVVDGRDREHCAVQAVEKLTSVGVVIFDDSRRPRYRSAIDFIKKAGFREIRFSGLAPMIHGERHTSVLYRSENILGI